MKLAVVGSRNFPNRAQVESYIATLPVETTVVSGGARGVDTWAVDAAKVRDLTTEVYPADWTKYGRAAGMVRNAQIVTACDAVVAFHDGRSRGTMHTIKLARGQGKPVTVFEPIR